MVGLPFANLSSNELNEKMKFISQSKEHNDPKQRGMEYYLNLCMRSVNQSIGNLFLNVKCTILYYL